MTRPTILVNTDVTILLRITSGFSRNDIDCVLFALKHVKESIVVEMSSDAGDIAVSEQQDNLIIVDISRNHISIPGVYFVRASFIDKEGKIRPLTPNIQTLTFI